MLEELIAWCRQPHRTRSRLSCYSTVARCDRNTRNIDCTTTARLKSSATAATPVVGYRVFKELDLCELQEEEGGWQQLSRFSRANPASFGRIRSDRLATLLQNPQSVFSYSQTSGLCLHGLDRGKLLSSYAPPSLGKAGDRTARTATSKV